MQTTHPIRFAPLPPIQVQDDAAQASTRPPADPFLSEQARELWTSLQQSPLAVLPIDDASRAAALELRAAKLANVLAWVDRLGRSGSVVTRLSLSQLAAAGAD